MMRVWRWLVSLFRPEHLWDRTSSLPAVVAPVAADPAVMGRNPTRFRIVCVHNGGSHRTNLGDKGGAARAAWDVARADGLAPPGSYFFYDRDVIRGSFIR
jgi:hypothetical protein